MQVYLTSIETVYFYQLQFWYQKSRIWELVESELVKLQLVELRTRQMNGLVEERTPQTSLKIKDGGWLGQVRLG